MTGTPQISGKDLVKILHKIGFDVIKQTGSHIKLAYKTPTGTETVIVPNHKTIKKGTLHSILRHTKVSIHDIQKLR